jgi:proton-translocating NADH-quinone oxidoreductase chain N
MNFILCQNDFIALIPELFLVFSVSNLIFYAVIYSSSPFLDFPLLLNNTIWLSLQALIFLFLLNLYNFCECIIFNKLLIIDNFSKIMKCILLFFFISFLFYLFHFNKQEGVFNFELVILLLFALLGFLILLSSYDLICMYLSIELLSFSSYILATFKRNSEFSTEAGLKYFILGAFSSNFLLFGCSLVYASIGTCNFENISFILMNDFDFKFFSLFIAFFFILISIFFKLSAAPFHFWSPDVYEGVYLVITLFFSIIPKISIFSLFVRLFFVSFYGSILFLQNFIILISILSMIVGCFGAITQIKIKRFLAFSAINNIGFMLLGFCCNSIQGIFVLFFYCIVYMIGSLSIFSILLLIYKNHDSKRLKYIKDFGILYKQNTMLGFCMSIIFFSFAGIPPLAGFLSKMLLFLNIVNNGLFFLVFLGIFVSFVSCFYYLRVIQVSFFGKLYQWVGLQKLDFFVSFFLSLNILFLILFFLHPICLIVIIYNAIFNLIF